MPPLTFRAAVLEHHNAKLALRSVTFPGPLLPGQVLVQVHYSGICGKQIEEIAGAHPDPYLPHMLGHEGSGIVAAIGPGVTTVQNGDHVVLHWMKGSGIDGPTPLYEGDGVRVNAGWITTFNEYAVVAENRATVIDPGHPLRLACLLGCAVTTGVGVAVNEARLRPNDSVAVIGCGGVGVNAIQGARLVSCHPIIAIDTDPDVLERARLFGATHCFTAERAVESVRMVTGGRGADSVIVTAAARAAIELASGVAATPGAVFVLGVPARGTRVELDALALHRRQLFTGSMGGGIMPDRDIPGYLAMHRRGALNLEDQVVAEYPLDDINAAIDLVRTRSLAGRAVIRMPAADGLQEVLMRDG